MRRFFALLLAFAVMAAPVGVSIGAASALPASAAASSDCNKKPCSCDVGGGDCQDVAACAAGCFGDVAAVLQPGPVFAAARSARRRAVRRVRMAHTVPPPLPPPQN